ncbi:MAG: polymorphic toxin type 23 domain-containing protein [Bacteroidota bacterium]|nr:polymorphic toxin type 23 domain-containing protein [Bacteroidota bacterium]
MKECTLGGFIDEVGEKHRLGTLTVGYKGWRVGTNSEHIRHAIQNRFIHNLIGDRASKTSLGIGNLIYNTERQINLHHGKKGVVFRSIVNFSIL